MKNKRIIIIGLDGVPFGLLKGLSADGTMPNTERLISEGVFRKMQSSIPEVSSVAWSSIITGCNPGQHGIFGFMDFAPGTYRLYFPNFDNLKMPPFWTKIAGRSVIMNVPSTYPVKELNGVHISGFVSVDLQRSVYPKALINQLNQMDYRLDVASDKARQSLDLFFDDLEKTQEARIRAYRYLWEVEDWQVFMLVFTGTDRLMHFLWSAYQDENHRYRLRFLEYFRQIDDTIGDIIDNLSDEDDLIMLSDHGFSHLEKDVYVNCLLSKEGFLKFQDVPNPGWGHIDSSTKAFALDPARIYINLKGKYPEGGVDPKDRESVLRDLEVLFRSFQVDGRTAIKQFYRKEEIYSGPFLEQAPDLVLIASDGFNLKASIKLDRLTDRDVFTGRHTQDDAFLLVRGGSHKNSVPEKPTVFDVVDILDVQRR